MKNLFYPIVLGIMFTACHNKEKAITVESVDGNEIFTVNLNYPTDPRPMKLSSWMENPRIVRLETNDSCLLGKCQYIIGEKYIVAFAREHIILFDSNGKYLRTLSENGRGAGEFSGGIITQTMDQTETKIVAYDMNYEILHQWSLPDGKYQRIPTAEKGDIHTVKILNDTILQLVNSRNALANYQLYTQSLSGNFQNGIPNTKKTRNRVYNASGNKRLFSSKDREYYRPVDSDTLYQVLPDTLMLKYVFPLTKLQSLNIIHANEKQLLATVSTEIKSETVVSKDGKSSSTRTEMEDAHYLVDMSKKEVAGFKALEDDYLGKDDVFYDMDIQDNGIVYLQYSIQDLMAIFPKLQEKKDLDANIRQRLEQLKAEVSEEDNPVLVIGEWKSIFQ